VVFSPEFGLHPKIASLRIPGVLQRIAVIYIVAAFLFLYTSNRVRWILGGLILIGYWLAMSFIPVPGYGAGAIDIPEGNLAAYIDQLLISGHMWKDLWDPEGILSTLPALVCTLMGIFVGQILLKNHQSPEHKILDLLTWGFIWLTIGYLWSWIFPLNKNIWTSSFSLFTGGLASIMFGFCYWYIDVKEYKKGINWGIAYGINAITVFFLSGIVARIMGMIHITVTGEVLSLKGVLYSVVLKGIFVDPMIASLSHSILWVFIFFILARWMQRKNILIKV
jgi:predicted acyltransferase